MKKYALIIIALLSISGCVTPESTENPDEFLIERQEPTMQTEIAETATSENKLDLLPLDGSEDPEIGTTLKTLASTNFDGSPTKIEFNGDSGQIIFVVSHACEHCGPEIEMLTALSETLNPDSPVKLSVISTNVKPGGLNWPPSDWIKKTGWQGNVLVDTEDRTLAASLGTPGYPFIVMAFADGTIVNRTIGGIPNEDLKSWIEILELEQMTAPTSN